MKKVPLLLVFVLALSMIFSACAPVTPEVATEEPMQPAEQEIEPTPIPPTEEPEPGPTEVGPASEAQLGAGFSDLLSSMKAYNTIKMDAFVEALAETPAPFLLDVRSPEEAIEKGHIDGAVLIPLRELGQNFDKLPSFDTPIVSYCGSGWRCTIAMSALVAMGWEDVTSLKDGSFGGWLEAGYPVEPGEPPAPEALNAADVDLSMALTMSEMFASIPEGWGVITTENLNLALVENPDLVVIDVRTQGEIDEKGYIESPMSLAIPLESFIESKSAWPTDKDTPIAIYCGSGHRSTMAMTILWSYGYTDVSSMKGGFSAWVGEGYPMAGAAAPDVASILDAAYADFLASMVKYNTMSLDELNLALAEDSPPYVLDVRTIAELEERGHIESAHLIPLNEVGANLDKLPSFDTPIVAYCGSGWRCTIAMTALGALGWHDTFSLKGGSFGGWVDAGYSVVPGLPEDPISMDAASPDPALAEVFESMFASIPAGFGGISVEDVALTLTEDPERTLIDVRTEAERLENGVIDAPNQLAIPLEEFIAMKDQWPTDLDTPIIVYCGSGHRSTMAMTILWSYGYTDVLSMKGGFNAYVGAGFPVGEVAAE